MDKFELRKEVEYAFIRTLGALVIIKEHKSFESDKKIFDKLYNTLTKEIVSYVSVGKISKLNYKLLDSVYEEFEELKSKWLYDSNLGEEVLLIDDCVIWSAEIINLIEENKDE